MNWIEEMEMKKQMNESRVRLAAAIASCNEAETAVSNAEATHRRAAALLAEAEQAVKAAGADAQSAADDHAALLAERLRRNERVDLLVPADEAVRAARIEAERRRDVAKLAESGLSAELAQARQQRAKRQADVEAAIYSVMEAERDDLIEQVETLQQAERAARYRLQGMSYLAIGKPGRSYGIGGPRFEVTERANRLIYNRDPQTAANHPSNADHDRWVQFLAELKQNATAQFKE
jgi:hypothetical protein